MPEVDLWIRIVLYCIYLADFVLEKMKVFLMQDLDVKYRKKKHI